MQIATLIIKIRSIFHNLSDYDTYLVIKEITADDRYVDVLPITKEKYISF